MLLTPSICEPRLSFQSSVECVVKLLTVADSEVLLFDGLPDQHCREAPGRLLRGTDRLTSALGEGMWLTSGQGRTTYVSCVQKGETHTVCQTY